MTAIVGLLDMLIRWTVCFQRQDGARRLQIEKDNWTQIHQVLNTRPFWEKNEAGVCRDMKQVYAAIWILLTLI